MADGARVPGGDRAQSLVAGRHRLPAAALRRCARQDRDALVPLLHLPAAMDREPALLPRARDRPDGARADRRAARARARRTKAGFARRYRHDAGARAVRDHHAGRRWSPAACRSRCGAIRCGRSRRSPRCVVRPGDRNAVRLRRFAAGFLVGLRRDAARLRGRGRPRAARARPSQGDAVSRPRCSPTTVTQRWREKFATPLALCGRRRVRHQQHRGLFARPAARDRARRSRASARGSIATTSGAAAPCWCGRTGSSTLPRWRNCARDYPGLDVQEPLSLPRQTFVARGTLQPGARALRHRAAAAR